MPDHIQYEDDDLFNPETRHESSDVPIRPLWWAVIIFIIFSILTHLALTFMYRVMVRAEKKRMDPPQTHVARPASADVPQNQPLLQPFPKKDMTPQQDTPVADMAHMREAERQKLSTYGWVDKQHGVVRIPIDNAKDLAVQRLKTPAAMPPATATSPEAAPAAATAPATTPAPATTTGGAQP